MSAPARSRLPAAERREALVEVASRVFAAGTYRGTTTAEIAAAAGVTEPILYRHFESKRDLYLACLERAGERVRAMWDDAVAGEPDPARWLPAMGRAFFETHPERSVIGRLWLQSLGEASEDEEVRAIAARHMKQAHAYVVGVIRRAQAAGGILPERDPLAEAWLFIGVGLLGSVGLRLGGLVIPHLSRIRESRQRWLTGR